MPLKCGKNIRQFQNIDAMGVWLGSLEPDLGVFLELNLARDNRELHTDTMNKFHLIQVKNAAASSSLK